MNAQDDVLPVSNQPEKQGTVIPVVEEQLHIDKKLGKSGTVRVSKRVTEHEQTVAISLLDEEIQVERVTLNQWVDSPPALRYEGETMIIPVIKEVAVVEKRLMLVEELHIVKLRRQNPEIRQVKLRKEEVTVERSNGCSDRDSE
ncbi:MAG: YsnF/AvaK domain-containing protein [Methylobacter sp.]